MIREKINNLNKLRFCCYFILLFIIIHVFVVVVLPNGALYSLDFSSAFASVIIAYFLSLCTILYRSFFYYDQFGNIKLIAVSWAMLSAYFLISGFKNDK